MLRINAGGFDFTARLEEADAPNTVAAFRRLLPLESKIIHVRWSGEGGWIPFGDLDLGLGPENATSYPNPVRSSSTPVASPRRRSSSRTDTSTSPRRRASSPEPLRDDRRGQREPPRAREEVLWEGAQEIALPRRR